MRQMHATGPVKIYDIVIHRGDCAGPRILTLHADGAVECDGSEDAAAAALQINEMFENARADERGAISQAVGKLLTACGDGRLSPSFAASISPLVGGWSGMRQ